MHRLYVGCYSLYVAFHRSYVGCYILYGCSTCVMWAIMSSMWAVTASMYDTQALHGLLHLMTLTLTIKKVLNVGPETLTLLQYPQPAQNDGGLLLL